MNAVEIHPGVSGATLLVEDDPVAREFIYTLLKKRGHTVAAFQSAEEAWEAYRTGTYPLVIVDWVLPGMSGPELCSRIRLLDKSRFTQILVVTAMDSPEEQQVALDAGADDYLTKPFSAHILNLRLGVAENNLRHRIARIINEDSMKLVLDDLGRCLKTDPLTGILNRQNFIDEICIETGRSRRARSPVSLMTFTLENLSFINNRHGLGGGDSILRHIAFFLGDNTREYDRTGRIAGDTFALLLPNTEAQGTRSIALRITGASQFLTCMYQGQEIVPLLGIGMTTLRPDNDGPESFLARALEGSEQSIRQAGAPVFME